MISPGDDKLPDLASLRIRAEDSPPARSRLTAGLLGVLLGAFGAHRFYLGYTRTAWTQLALTIGTAGLAGVWGVAEGWLILAGKFGCDARGCALTHHSAVHLLAATVGSFTLHVGMTLGIVWWGQYSAAWLVPPPSGVNSIALSPATPQDPSLSEPITLTPPRESETPPEIEPAEAAEPNETAPPLEEITATSVITAPLTDDADEAPMLERQPTAEPSPPADRAVELHATAQRSTPNKATQPEQPTTTAQASATPPPAVPRTPTDVAPTTTATPSPASIASRESQGFDTDTLPAAVDFRQPVYPPELRQRGVTGLVKLRVRVGADGRVKRASVYRTSGYAAFDRAALEAINDWRFQPARRAGVAVEMEIAVPIRFVIEEK